MKKSITKLILILGVLACSSCVIIPTITHTHLADDIREDQFSIAAGVETVVGESPAILPDIAYGYVSYAPTDWLEVGAAAHYALALIGADIKIDLIGIVSDGSPWSAMLLGGAMVSPSGGGLIVHAGIGGNYRVGERVEFFATAGTNSPFFVPMFQIGSNLTLLKWLSLSASAKLAVNTLEEGEDSPPVAFMVSISPSFNFDLAK